MSAPFADNMQQGGSRAARRPSPLWWLAATALAVALALPFFLVDVPPVLDYPNHLARYFVLAHPDDPVLSQMYSPRWGLMPNLGMDVLGAGLLKVVDVHVGGRLLLELSAFTPVVGVVVYSRVAFGRFSYWPLASGAIAFNGVFHLGFMNFLLALGLALIAGAGWMMLRRREAIWPAAAFGALAAAMLFFCHLFGVLLFALLIGAGEMSRLFAAWRAGRLTPGGIVRSAGALICAGAPALVLYLASPLASGAAAPAAVAGAGYKSWALLTPFMTTSADLTLWTALIVLVAIGLGWRRMQLAPGFAIAFGILLLAYVVAPSAIKGGTFVDVRLAVMLGLLLFAGLRPRMSRRLGVAVGIVFATLIGARTFYIATTWISHRDAVANMRLAMAPLAPGAKVMIARGRPLSDVDADRPERMLPGIYRLDTELSALMVVERRAFWPLLFADPAQQPLQVNPAFAPLSQSPGGPVAWAKLSQPFAEAELQAAPYLRDWRATFDNVLLIDPPVPLLPPPAGLTLLQATPDAALYRVTR